MYKSCIDNINNEEFNKIIKIGSYQISLLDNTCTDIKHNGNDMSNVNLKKLVQKPPEFGLSKVNAHKAIKLIIV